MIYIVVWYNCNTSKEENKKLFLEILRFLLSFLQKFRQGELFPVHVEATEHEMDENIIYILKIDIIQSQSCSVTFDLYGSIIAASHMVSFLPSSFLEAE